MKCLTSVALAMVLTLTGSVAMAVDTLDDNPENISMNEPHEESLVKDVQVQPIPGGINPSAFAYTVDGLVFAGSNPCLALGVTVALKQVVIEESIHIRPLRIFPANYRNRICTMEWNPIWIPANTTVRGIRGDGAENVILENVMKLDNDIEILQLLDD